MIITLKLIRVSGLPTKLLYVCELSSAQHLNIRMVIGYTVLNVSLHPFFLNLFLFLKKTFVLLS